MIEVSDVYKSFTLKDKRTLKIKTIAAVRGYPFRFSLARYTDFWALTEQAKAPPFE